MTSIYEQADELHAKGELQAAIDLLGSDESAFALYRKARWSCDMVDLMEDAKNKEEILRVAEKTALLSVEKDPTIHETHKAVAITKGKLQNFVGMAEKVRLAKEVKEYIEKSLEIRPTDSASWHVLGMWHAGVTKLGWVTRQALQALYLGNFPHASYDKAIECLQNAHQHWPNASSCLELAKIYKTIGKGAEAKEWLKKSLEMPSDLPHYRLSQEEARKLLEQW
uniref:Regulator of microtubule dynamics protein 1 n=1 Tax=Hanusia phi TaxID=3032 RepID=A0A7S0EJT4_9CRYP|mmetsp:Transcript_25553/g.57485  ORF Transcript_25553/g.57485 Transcript_25553/m.57485 type:complete len:224 (+) Transcript_25553:1-672(+)